MTSLSKYRKALVAVGGAVVAIGAAFGIPIDPVVVNSVVGTITALLVYIVPNDS